MPHSKSLGDFDVISGPAAPARPIPPAALPAAPREGPRPPAAPAADRDRAPAK